MSEHSENENAENGDFASQANTGGTDTFTAAAAKSHTEALNIIGRLFDVASPRAIFSKPVNAGEYTVITASEVTIGMGLGFGGGGGESSRPSPQIATPDNYDTANSPAGAKDVGGGIGGGGGGASAARPVAAIIIGPNGVSVEPIFDITKVGIAFITALGALFMTRRAMRKAKTK